MKEMKCVSDTYKQAFLLNEYVCIEILTSTIVFEANIVFFVTTLFGMGRHAPEVSVTGLRYDQYHSILFNDLQCTY